MYPDESIQGIMDPPHKWWEKYEGDEYKRGRLVWIYAPHVDQTPFMLIPIARSEPTVHNEIHAKIQPLNTRKAISYPHLPVAALPQYEDEVRTVYRAKRRPALIVCRGGPRIERALTRDRAKWRTSPAVVVAPYYGAERGFNPEFIRRVQLCEYPQFMWDLLPMDTKKRSGSILRLDHMQPVGRSQDSIAFTGYCLTRRALLLLDEWIGWLFSGTLDRKTKLREIRDVLLDEA